MKHNIENVEIKFHSQVEFNFNPTTQKRQIHQRNKMKLIFFLLHLFFDFFKYVFLLSLGI